MSSCNVHNRNVHIVNSNSQRKVQHQSHKAYKPVICKSLLVKSLNISKSTSSCNLRKRNLFIINSISHHTKPLSVGKSNCASNINKPVIRESVIANFSKLARKRSCNVSSHKHDISKPLNVRNILMKSIYFYELVLLFSIFHENFCNVNVDNFFKGYVTRNNFSWNKFLNYDGFIYHDVNILSISDSNGLSSSDRFYSFYFCKYSFFIYIVHFFIFCVNNITHIFDNNLYITGLSNRDNKFLHCNYKVTVESITLFPQENKFKVYKIFITSQNNSFFLIIIFIIFKFFSRKLNKCLSLCYFSVSWFSIVSLKFQINNGIHFNFSLLQKSPKNDFFNLAVLTSCGHIQHMTLHKNFAFLALANLKYKNYIRRFPESIQILGQFKDLQI